MVKNRKELIECLSCDELAIEKAKLSKEYYNKNIVYDIEDIQHYKCE